MNVLTKVFCGLLCVGLTGAVALGLLVFAALVFGDNVTLPTRIIFAALVVALFYVGYAEGGGGSGEETDGA